MISINKISEDEIVALDDQQLVKVMEQLVWTEINTNSIITDDVSFPENTRAADGGEDGHIKWKGFVEKTTFLPMRHIVYQAKADNAMGKEKCANEISKTNADGTVVIKPVIQEKVVDGDAGYILFHSRGTYSDQSKRDRVDAIKERFKDLSGREDIYVDLFTAGDIKKWVNQYPTIVVYVQELNGLTRPKGIQTYSEWSNEQYFDLKYHTNDKIESHLHTIRTKIKDEQACIRIIGHSGLGKSRLCFEAFKFGLDDGDEIKALQSQILYYDVGKFGHEDINAFANVISNKYSAIIIVDDCDEETYSHLQSIIKRRDSSLKLISMDYDVTNKIAIGYNIELVSEDFVDVIEAILKSTYAGRGLEQREIKQLSDFCEGYTQLAVQFAELRIQGQQELSDLLSDRNLEKLIWGKSDTNENAYKLIKSLSIFDYVGFQKGLETQIDFVLYDLCGGMSKDDFRTYASFFVKRNVLVKRRLAMNVKPIPVACKLATEWWRANAERGDLDDFFKKICDVNLLQPLGTRFGMIDSLEEREHIRDKIWALGGNFLNAEVLNSNWGSQLFRIMCTVNPSKSASDLRTIYGGASIETLQKVKEGRREIVRALERLCFPASSFVESAKTLLDLGAAEIETWANNSTGLFPQFFQVQLCGTEATFNQRLEVIDYGLGKNLIEYDKIIISALSRGIRNEGYTRMVGAEYHGTKKPLKDYNPKSWNEVEDYWNKCMDILLDYAERGNQDEVGQMAISGIKHAITILIRDKQVALVFDAVSKITVITDSHWKDGLDTLKFAKHRFSKILTEAEIKILDDAIEKLEPNDILYKLQNFIVEASWEPFENSLGEPYRDRQKDRAESYADELANSTEWYEHISELSIGEQRYTFYFGKRLAQKVEELDVLLDEAKRIYIEVGTERNATFLGGLLTGSVDKTKVDPILHELIAGNLINNHQKFYLVRTGNLSEPNLELLFSLVNTSTYVGLEQFKQFKYGIKESMGEELFNKFILRLLGYGNDGRWIALNLMLSAVFGEESEFLKHHELILSILSSENLLNEYKNPNCVDASAWSMILERLIKHGISDATFDLITAQIKGVCYNKDIHSFDPYIGNVSIALMKIDFRKFFDQIQNVILGDYLGYMNLKFKIGSKNGNGNERALLWEHDNDYILDWCRANAPLAPIRIADMMPLIEEGEWHPFAKAIIDEFGENEKVLIHISTNMGTYGMVGSSVGYLESLLKLSREYIEDPREKVKKWAQSQVKSLRADIDREKDSDESYSYF